MPDVAEAGDRFGATLALGDFDNAVGDDLAVGAPGETIDGNTNAGAVQVLRGASGGLTATSTFWTENSPGIELRAATGDTFGASLAAGDFDGDTHADLAIGAPGDDVAFAPFLGTVLENVGSVTLIRGSIVGPRPAGILRDHAVDNPTNAATGSRMGAGLAVADLGGITTADGYEDLVIAASGARVPNGSEWVPGGRIELVYSDSGGVGFDFNRLEGVELHASAQIGFGVVPLTARRYGGVGLLAVGMPASGGERGGVNVYSSGTKKGNGVYGLRGSAMTFTQESPGGRADAPGAGDRFGSAVGFSDVDRNGKLDLIAGSPGEDSGTKSATGAVHVFRNAASTGTPVAIYSQGTGGTVGNPEAGDVFGAAVAR